MRENCAHFCAQFAHTVAVRCSWQAMVTRIAFDADRAHALRVRGLTLTEAAQHAGVTVATASAAVRGRPVNVKTALLLSRAVSAVPVVRELEEWARAPAREPIERDQLEKSALLAAAVSGVRWRPIGQETRPEATGEQLRIELA